MGLTAPQISWLRQLANLVRAAPTNHDRAALITVVLRTAWRHRADGASWSEIAIALGVTDNTLRRWRSTDTKPMTPPHRVVARPSHTELPEPPRTHADTTRSGFETISAHTWQNQSQHITSTASAPIFAHNRTDTGSARTPSSGTRRVLVVSGDPRPGGNFFGPEAFTATIKRSFRPRLVVMNLCNSHAMSESLACLVDSLITWPDVVDDDQSRLFAGQLYHALATGRTVGQAHGDSRGALEELWPGLHPPVLTVDQTSDQAAAIF